MDLINLGKTPVSESRPAGDDARYEPEYDQLQQEIDKLTSVTAGGPINWKQVVKLSSVLLSSKSKDIKVASYLGVALLNLKGVEGLSASVQILLDLVTDYWDTMYPAKKRMRGRFNAISWWSDTAEKFLSNYDDGDIPQAKIQLLVQRITDLDTVLAEKADDAPILRSLADSANRLPAVAEKIAETVDEQGESASDGEQDAQGGAGKPAATTGAGSASLAGTATPPAPVGNVSSPEDYQRNLDAGLAGLSVLADYLLANDLADVMGYRLRRFVAWTPIVALPPSEKGLTMIPPPDGSVKDSIVSQLNNSEFPDAIQAAESRVGQFLFWLDLSHLTVIALEGLEGEYLKAKLVVELEVSLLLKRVPGIESMTFSDGTPFADSKTKAWLKSLNRENDSSLGGGTDKDSVADKVFVEATKLAKSKKIFDAVSMIQESLNSNPSGHERFLHRVGMVNLLTDVDQSGLAHAHVEELLEHIKKYRLEEWDPNLALRALKTAYDALISEGGDGAIALAKDTLKRLGRINPVQALKINGLN